MNAYKIKLNVLWDCPGINPDGILLSKTFKEAYEHAESIIVKRFGKEFDVTIESIVNLGLVSDQK